MKYPMVTASSKSITVFGFVNNGKTQFCKFLNRGYVKHLDASSEEKRRGMTINLGQTYLWDTARAIRYYILDAPGHVILTSRLLIGLNLATIPILVISCHPDDSAAARLPFYQAILKAYRVPRVVVILSKTDLVSQTAVQAMGDTVVGTLGKTTMITLVPFHKFMDSGVLDTLLAILAQFPDAPIRRQGLVIRSFDVNKAGTPLADIKGAVLGTWGLPISADKLYLSPVATPKGFVSLPIAIVHKDTIGDYAATLETDLYPSKGDDNKLVGTILTTTPVALHSRVIFTSSLKVYQRAQQLILVCLHTQVFAKIHRITDQKTRRIELTMSKPIPAPLLAYPVQVCRRVDYAWTLTELVNLEHA